MVLTFLSYPGHLQLSPIHSSTPGVRTAVPRKRRNQSSVDCKLGTTKQGEARGHDFNFPAIVSGDAIEIHGPEENIFRHTRTCLTADPSSRLLERPATLPQHTTNGASSPVVT